MADQKEALVPDIGGYDNVPVIEVLVNIGDTVEVDQGLVTLESEKATMEVPSSIAGVVKEIKVKVGDNVAEGAVVAIIETAGGEATVESPAPAAAPAAPAEAEAPAASAPAPKAASSGGSVIAKVPDIGGYDSVPVIELLVNVGDTVALDQGLVTLESEKATMEVPSSAAGVIKELKVKVGDNVAEGAEIAVIETEGGAAEEAVTQPVPKNNNVVASAETGLPVEPASGSPAQLAAPQTKSDNHTPNTTATPPVTFGVESVDPSNVPYASPSVRMFARELGVDLSKVTGTERNGRIGKEDVQKFVKGILSGATPMASSGSAVTGGGELNLLPWPKVDFAKFGEIESKPLSRIQKISGANLARNWVMIPHVTQFDRADITDLEELRQVLNKENEKAGIKFTMLAFLIKACANLLAKYPNFNASLEGDNLILKKYFHIGFAADTPNGLVVPVVRDVDKKGVAQIATEMSELAKKARDGKLGPADMTGGCFSISSLGGIGGTAFTPIVNAPEVAILGVSKSEMAPVWNGKEFEPRLMLPLSLSYDHRVIDGAAAARFTADLAKLLGDMRRALV